MITGYELAVALVRARVLDFITRSWRGLGRWNRDDIDRFVAAIVPQVEAGQVTTAALTDAYLAQLERTVLGTAARTAGVDALSVTTEALRGVPANEVYQRSGVTVWRALKGGAPLDKAVDRGLERAVSIASTDLQLAKTHTARRVMQASGKAQFFRRSLTGVVSCGLCVVASTQRYRIGDLLPIHPACDCGVIPIFSEKDPGQIIDPDKLDDVHLAIDDRFGAFSSGAREIPGAFFDSGDPVTYRDVLVTHTHSEVGPVLAVRGQHFTTAKDF